MMVLVLVLPRSASPGRPLVSAETGSRALVLPLLLLQLLLLLAAAAVAHVYTSASTVAAVVT
jgi:hypothetical protein